MSRGAEGRIPPTAHARSNPARPRFRQSAGVLIAALCLASFAARAEDSGVTDLGAAPLAPPAVIYVTDFEIDIADVDSGGLRPLRRLRDALSGETEAGREAHDLVDRMATALVDDLNAKGFTAVRLPPDTPLPPAGWLVRGVFTEADSSGRLRRAVIGFGAGHTDLEVKAAVDDLAKGALQPFYRIETGVESGKMPGGIIMRNPYVMAAKFVLAGRDLDRNVKQTAGDIAGQIAALTKPSP